MLRTLVLRYDRVPALYPAPHLLRKWVLTIDDNLAAHAGNSAFSTLG
jgi:hypothetical protein